MSGKMLVMMDEDDLRKIIREELPKAAGTAAGNVNVTADGVVHSPFGAIPPGGLEPAKEVKPINTSDVVPAFVTASTFLASNDWGALINIYNCTKEQVMFDINNGRLSAQYWRR